MSKSLRNALLVVLSALLTISMVCFAFSLGGEKVNATTTDKGIINVYLIAGQSNAVGYGQDHTQAVVTEDSRFNTGFANTIYYGEQERWGGSTAITDFAPVKIGQGVANDRSGAEIGIASALKDSDTMNAVIKCAWGATHLYPDEVYDISYQQGTWTSPSYIASNNVSKDKNALIGRMYTWWEQTVTTGIAKLIEQGYTPVIKGLWWMQGEAEMFSEQMSSAYDELLTALIGDMRNSVSKITGYDCSQMPFVFGLPIWNLKNSNTPPYQLDVRENMQSVANNTSIVNVDCVDCAGLFQHDDWHFDARGQKYLGEQFIAKLANLNEGNIKLKESIKLAEGPQIRLEEGKKGLHFVADIVNYNKANNYEYGMLIVPNDYLTDNAISSEYVKAFADKNKNVLNLTCFVNQADYDNDGIVEDYIQGTITDIKYKNLSRDFAGVAYIKDANGNYNYTAVKFNSIANVASNEVLNYSSTQPEYAELLKFANGAINYKNGVAEENGYASASFDLEVPETFEVQLGAKVYASQLPVAQVPAMGYKVKYTATHPDVAKVDEFGLVTPVAFGETTITVQCLNVTKTIAVTVKGVTIDGVVLDGAKDEAYGTNENQVLLNGDRSYTISALKTSSGVFIYSQGVFNTTVNNSDSWYLNTNFEFRLNGGIQSYVNTKNNSTGVTQFANSVKKTASGKYLHTVELFVDKSIISNWSDTKDVQLNYAWKTPNEKAYIMSDMVDYTQVEWSTDWHSYQKLGALEQTFTNGAYISNLFIAKTGLSWVQPSGIDGVISANEYPTKTVTKSSANISVTMAGKVADGDLYLALTITHNAWSAYDNGAGNWWKNDNAEIYVNDVKMPILFLNGIPSIPASYTSGKAVTTTGENNKLITVLELYIQGDALAYKTKVGFNGTAFAWLGLMWDQNNGTITSDGVNTTGTIDLGNGVLLDGELTDSIWTETVKSNNITTTANETASFDIIGTKTNDGVYVALTITHKKAPNVSTDGSNKWYTFINVEMRLNNTNYQTLHVYNGQSANTASAGYAKTIQNADGTYTTIFEIFVPDSVIGVTDAQTGVDVVFGGWFETNFVWLFGGTTNATHTISSTGIKAKV